MNWMLLSTTGSVLDHVIMTKKIFQVQPNVISDADTFNSKRKYTLCIQASTRNVEGSHISIDTMANVRIQICGKKLLWAIPCTLYPLILSTHQKTKPVLSFGIECIIAGGEWVLM